MSMRLDCTANIRLLLCTQPQRDSCLVLGAFWSAAPECVMNQSVTYGAWQGQSHNMNNIFITGRTKLNTTRLDVTDQPRIKQILHSVVWVQSQFINSYNHVIINYHYYLNTIVITKATFIRFLLRMRQGAFSVQIITLTSPLLYYVTTLSCRSLSIQFYLHNNREVK